MKRFLKAALFFVALLVVWELCVRARLWPKVLLPSPLKVAGFIGESAADGTLLAASWVTLKRLLLGYVAGIVLGVLGPVLYVALQLVGVAASFWP